MTSHDQPVNRRDPRLWAQFLTSAAPSVQPLDVDDIPAAAKLLTDVNCAAAPGRLLGTVTVAAADLAMAWYVDLLLAAQRHGRVELCWAGGRIVGVACWIRHTRMTGASPPARATPAGEIAVHLDRLGQLDLVFDVPDGTSHAHLACLGTENRHGSRMIADLLLYHQHQLADRNGYTLHTEVHSPTDRDWLGRYGYTDHGASLIPASGTASYAMARSPQPRVPRPRIPRPRAPD